MRELNDAQGGGGCKEASGGKTSRRVSRPLVRPCGARVARGVGIMVVTWITVDPSTASGRAPVVVQCNVTVKGVVSAWCEQDQKIRGADQTRCEQRARGRRVKEGKRERGRCR